MRAAEQHVRFLLVSGKLILEPIARYGPFVMDTQEEIERALKDLQNGTFVDSQPQSDTGSWYGASSVRELNVGLSRQD